MALCERSLMRQLVLLTGLLIGVVWLLAGSSAVRAAPVNDDFSSAATIGPLPYSTTVDTSEATLESGEPQPCIGSTKTVWFAFTAPATGSYQIDTFGSSFDTVFSVYTGSSLSGLSYIDCADDTVTGSQSRLQLQATAGTVYRIQAGGYTDRSGTLVVNVAVTPPPPANDTFAAAIAVNNLPFADTQFTAQTTLQSGEKKPSCWDIDHTVWYAFTPATSGMYQIDTLDSDYNTVLTVYTGSTLNGLSELVCNDDADDVTVQSKILVSLTAGTTYRIQAAGLSFAQWGVHVSDYGRLVVQVTSPTADSDGDGCTDVEELGDTAGLGGDRDPSSPWDFFDVPAPAGTEPAADGRPTLTAGSVRNRAVSLQDVSVVLAYVGRLSSSPFYIQDNNGDGLADGQQLDRTPSTDPSKPWRSGAPNGAIALQDVSIVLAQVGHSCAAPP
jgi:hypothetical protein